MATCLCDTFLEKYGTKCSSTSIGVYFMLCIMGAVKCFEHGHTYNTIFKLLKHILLKFFLFKVSNFMGQQL